jgi:hypothetical protein
MQPIPAYDSQIGQPPALLVDPKLPRGTVDDVSDLLASCGFILTVRGKKRPFCLSRV